MRTLGYVLAKDSCAVIGPEAANVEGEGERKAHLFLSSSWLHSRPWSTAHQFRPWRFGLAAAVAMGLAGALAWQIATGTRYDSHPDEHLHVDAFCYYQLRWWTPPVNTDGLDYSQYGTSRVYTGELVYWVYGRAAAVLGSTRLLPTAATMPETDLGAQLALCKPGFQIYRLFNVALLLSTLALLFVVGRRQAWAAAIGLLMVCLPQVIYVYSYANSDAWALSAALALLTFALAAGRPLSSLGKSLLLGLLAALVYLAKATMWIAIPFALAVIAYRLWQSWRTGRLSERVEILRVARNTVAAVALFTLAITPTMIIYPWSQGGHLREQLRQVQELRASPGLKPSNPSQTGYRLRSKGAGFEQIALNVRWIALSAMSFYGIFGYMTIRAPAWAYLAALVVGAANALLSVGTAWRNWKRLPDSLRLVFGLAPLVIGGIVGASMYSSWTGEFQPQGRYLFIAIVPMAIWLWGLLPWEGPLLRAFRGISILALAGLCALVLGLKVL